MSWFKMKIRPVDTLFSQVVRTRDKMLCRYNFKCLPGTQGSQTSHFKKRGIEATRCDLLNGDWVCGKCHYFVENEKDGQKTLEEFKKKQLGEMEYKLLLIRANDGSRKWKDDKMNLIILKQRLKELTKQL